MKTKKISKIKIQLTQLLLICLFFSSMESFADTFQAEDYVNFHDTSKGNAGGDYRTDDVDIKAFNRGEYYVGWIEKGEWLVLGSLTVPTSGNYVLKARVASPEGGQFSVDLNAGSIVLGEWLVPATGGFNTWIEVSKTVYIDAGVYDLGMFALSKGWNIDWIEVVTGNDSRLYADKSRGEWSLLVVPDTQHYSQNRDTAPVVYMHKAFDWIVAIKDQLNLQFVQGLGDITENWDVESEWLNATSAWYKLYNQVPFMPVQGNHDSPEVLNQYFPVSSFSKETWWGGDFGGIENNYGLMTIGEEDYMFLHVESYDPYSPYRPEGIEWAKQILSNNPNRKVILATHDIWKGRPEETIKNQLLTKYDNIVLASAGHDCVREAMYVTQGPNGGVSHNFVTDYQCDEQEIMLLRYYVFKPLEDKVDYYTYSPITHQFESDANSQGSFVLIQADPVF